MRDDVEAYYVAEGTSRTFEAYLEADGVPISGDDLLSLTLTIRNDFTREIIANRNAANVLNTSGVLVDTVGHLIWAITPLETALLNRRLPSEPHRVLFEWTYISAAVLKTGNYEFLLWVQRNDATAA